MRKLKPEEEIDFIGELQLDPKLEKAYTVLRGHFSVLQVRSQMLIGLVTICLTITGFSGIRIADSGMAAKLCIFVGICSTLLTALLLISGPLNLQWLTQYRGESNEATLAELFRRRDQRTKVYQMASLCLVIGLGGYTMSMAFYLLLS